MKLKQPEVHFSTRHMPRKLLDQLHVLGVHDAGKKLWQLHNMALRRGIRELAREMGLEKHLFPTTKNGTAKELG